MGKIKKEFVTGLAGARKRHEDADFDHRFFSMIDPNYSGVDAMALTTLTLEVRTDFSDPEKQAALLEAVKMAARDITTTACLLQERQVPEINLYENTMEGGRTINLVGEGA